MSTSSTLDLGTAVETVTRRRVVLALTMIGAFVVSLDVSIANAVLPAVGQTFAGATRPALSWTITAYAITFAAVLVPAGRLADRGGRRRAFLGGLGVFAIGSALCGLSWSLPALLAGRVIQGIGAAAAQPASLALLLAAGGTSQRAELAARWSGAGAVGIAAGPVVGGALTTLISWRLAFLVNLPVVAFAYAFGPRSLPESERHPGRSLPDPLGALLLATTAATLTFAISEVTSWGIGDRRILIALGVAVLAGAAFVHRSRTSREPLLELGIFRRRSVLLVTLTTVFYAAGFFGLLFSFVLFLTSAWHLTTVAAGLCITPMAATVAVLSFKVGGVARSRGFRLPLAIGNLLAASGLVANAVLQSGSVFQPSWIGVAIVIGIGVALCYLLLGSAAVDGLPATHLASATAVNQCARQLGAALGVAATVAVLEASKNTTVAQFHDAWLLCAGFCVLAALSALALRAPTQGTSRA